MNATVIIIVVLLVFAVVIYLVLQRKSSDGGFRDWVKDPSLKSMAELYFLERDALTVPDDISEGEIQAMVDRLFVAEDSDFNLEKLKLVGEKATPLLISALNTEKAFNTTFNEDKHSLDAGSPFERICDILEETCPPSAANPLARYACHPEEHFRKYAGIVLGNIGTDECIQPIVRLLGDDEDYVRSYAMMGIERGIAGDYCTSSFLNSVFPTLELLLDRRAGSTCGLAPKLMLAIDREKAISIVLSEKYFTTGNEELQYIISALNEADVLIPHNKLLPLIEEFQSLIDEYPYDYCFASALTAYARNPNSETESLLLKFGNSKNDCVAESAADGLAILSGVPDPASFVFEQFEASGWEGLTTEQKNFVAVFIYNSEVNNGGHSQYFVNSSGDNSATALGGLHAIGATKKAGILSKAMKLFGDNGPSADNNTRHEQLAAFSEQKESQLNSLDSQYYGCEERIHVLLSNYAVANKEFFSSLN